MSGTGAAQGHSLLCCLGRARAAKPAHMARSGVGIFRLLPHSLGEWMLWPVALSVTLSGGALFAS